MFGSIKKENEAWWRGYYTGKRKGEESAEIRVRAELDNLLKIRNSIRNPYATQVEFGESTELIKVVDERIMEWLKPTALDATKPSGKCYTSDGEDVPHVLVPTVL